MNNQPQQQEKQQIDLLKWGLGCTGLAMLLCTGIIMFSVIVMPVIFRNLDPEDQARIVRKLPFMGTFEPTHPFVYLPTIASTSANAAALLATSVESTAAPVQASDLSAGGDGSTLPTMIASPTAQQLLPVPTATSTTPPPTLAATQTTAVTVQPSATLQSTATTLPPTLVPTTPPAPTAKPSATLLPLPVSYHSQGYKWIPQTWNNCGPANLTQVLNAMGWTGDQSDAASYLKPTKNDKNVSPWQMVTYVNEQVGPTLGLKALMRYAGDLALVKRLVSQNFGVIMETGYDVAGEGWMGHYLTVIGYDDAQNTLYGLDTYLGDGPDSLGFHEDYNDINRRWMHFNRVYLVIYPKSRESELAAILGPDADFNYNANHALTVAKAEAATQASTPYPWFNMGTSYVLLHQYKEAATAFDQAWSVGGLPWRMLWYQFTPYEAYYNAGNYMNVLALAETSLKTTTDVEETYYWRGMAEAAMGKTQQAVSDLKHAVNYNHNFSLAVTALAALQDGSFKPPVVAQNS